MDRPKGMQRERELENANKYAIFLQDKEHWRMYDRLKFSICHEMCDLNFCHVCNVHFACLSYNNGDGGCCCCHCSCALPKLRMFVESMCAQFMAQNAHVYFAYIHLAICAVVPSQTT